MYRALLLLLAAALIAACVPLDARQSTISSADEAIAAVVEMAGDNGWDVTSISATSVVARAPGSDDDYDLIYNVVTGPKGSRLTLNMYRFVNGSGQQYVQELHYYEDFFDELATYQ